MHEIAFPEKPLQADIPCRKAEKKIHESQYSVRKYFSIGSCTNGLPSLKKKKLRTKSLFRKSPFRPIYRAVKTKKIP